ncbi:hypothetical protein [Parasediminibacterium sp. JCM 36343]|uniref:hypothetical protein n=1 Tax=Parasediminibacterium sp. JCM 36343 TaxID=3374279 RepID=UPI00397AAFA3
MNRNLILSIVSIVCWQQGLLAQNNASPYSIIGIGDIEKSSFDRTSSMGHAGMALSSNRFFYNANPASYSALDDRFFNVEIAARYKTISYSGTPIAPTANQSSDLQFKKLVLAIKIKPKLAAAVGILPFSTANYSFYGNKTVQGSSFTAPAYYEGTGGVNQFFLASSYKFSTHFSLGAQVSYLFGQLNQTETIGASFSDSLLVTQRKIPIGTPSFKPGFQYNAKLNKNWQLFVGGTATFKTTINSNYHLTVTDGNTSLPNNNAEVMKFTLPAIYAGSIAAKLKDKYTVAADYSFQNWANLNYSGLSYNLVNSNHFGIGFESAKKLYNGLFSFEKNFIQAGFFYDNSYLRISGQQITDYGVTVGGGFNSFKNNLGVQLGAEIGRRGTTTGGLIQENYFQVNAAFSYRDFWFVKVKRFD